MNMGNNSTYRNAFFSITEVHFANTTASYFVRTKRNLLNIFQIRKKIQFMKISNRTKPYFNDESIDVYAMYVC